MSERLADCPVRSWWHAIGLPRSIDRRSTYSPSTAWLPPEFEVTPVPQFITQSAAHGGRARNPRSSCSEPVEGGTKHLSGAIPFQPSKGPGRRTREARLRPGSVRARRQPDPDIDRSRTIISVITHQRFKSRSTSMVLPPQGRSGGSHEEPALRSVREGGSGIRRSRTAVTVSNQPGQPE